MLGRDEPVPVRVHLQHADDVVCSAGQRVSAAAQLDDGPFGRERVEVPAEGDPLLARDPEALLQFAGGRRPREHVSQRLQQFVARHGIFGSRRMASASRVFAV